MDTPFKATKVSDHVYWVGAIDWDLRDFHGYSTYRGSTYNAYLIMAEKITLIDTVKAPFKDELLSRIASVVDPSSIDYIVCNHAEMDHSGCLPEIVATVKPEKVFASPMGVQALEAHHFPTLGEVQSIGTGESLSLGDMQLLFLETRMLHWPDSMFSYLPEDGILFSQDAFGLHFATSNLFVDENDPSVVRFESSKYFANILTPFNRLVAKTLEKVVETGWDIKILASDHGPIWRENLGEILGLYSHWLQMRPTRKAVVVYDTMWKSTTTMARAIADGLQQNGAVPVLMPLSGSTRSDVATELLEAGALLIGSPTLNNQMLPSLADTLTYLKGLKPKNLIGAAFGSYGWSGEATGQLEEALKDLKVEIVEDPIKVKYVPTNADLIACRQMGERIATRLVELAPPLAP